MISLPAPRINKQISVFAKSSLHNCFRADPKRSRTEVEKKTITFSTVEGKPGDTLDKLFNVKTSFVRVHPSDCLLPPKFVFYARRIRDLEVYEDDVWMVSYPRTGSNWAQEMVWCIGNDFNYENAQQTMLIERNPLLEASTLMVSGEFAEWYMKLGDSVESVENMPRPRYIKSHLPWDLLPEGIHEKKPKVIYVARNPKDTCVSFYHYCRTFHDLTGSFEDFAQLFVAGNSPMGSFWNHVLKFWQMRNQENILFLKYEDMKRDQATAIRRTAEFLGKSVTDDQVTGLCDHLDFSKMAANPAVNLEGILKMRKTQNDDPNYKFIRKGKVGDWRNHMSEDLSQRFDEWTERNLRGTGLTFETESVSLREE